MFTTKYYYLNGNSVAIIGKSGSTALGKAVTLATWPDFAVVSGSNNQENLISAVQRPGLWQAAAPQGKDPIGTVIIPVRDPVERFRSACAQDSRTAEEQLALVEAGQFNIHTRPVVNHIASPCVLFKFPEHLAAIASTLGTSDIEPLNEAGEGAKPVLTAAELARVTTVYAQDIALFDSITAPALPFTPPPSPEQVLQTLYDTAAAAFATLSIGKQTMWEPVRQAVGAAILRNDLATARSILETLPVVYEGAEEERAAFLALLP